MSVKFAPINIPFARRLQTLSAAFWIVSLTFGSLICWAASLYILIFSSYWPLGVIYAAWAYYFDKDTPFNGGRKWCFLQNLPLWKYFVDFFPIRLVKTTDLPADRNYLFCVYPHGILSAGIFGNFANKYSERKTLFPNLNIHSATLDLHFKVPIFRDYLLALGAVSSSSRSLCNILGSETKGKVCILIVGGAAESLYAKPGPYRIILNKRKGFVKIALITGCSLVPVFSFGEIDLYDQVSSKPGSKLHKAQVWFKNQTGMALCVPKGRGLFQYSFGIVPQRSPITTVVGAPIEVPKIPNPSKEDIDHYHDIYTKKLLELFNEHKGKYVANPDEANLIIE